MDGKTKYKNKDKQIKSTISKYKAINKQAFSKAIMCLDCDDYYSNPEDKEFLNKARKHCDEQQYDLVWFCKDIENVYLGHVVEKHHKKEEAVNFAHKENIKIIPELKLKQSKIKEGYSNILLILDEYIPRKERSH